MLMEKLLTSKERENLIQRHRKERDKRVCDRIKAVLAYDDGYSYSEIAKILLLDDETIRRHIEDYQTKKKLNPESGGSESKLTKDETFALINHLSEITYLYVKDICEHVKRCYKKKYTISGMTKWLHTNEFCYKKPHAVPAKADRKQQKKFIAFYKRLKAKVGKKEPIYFADSVHPQHQTQLVYGWIPKGVHKEIATTGRQYRLNFIGGICLNGHRFTYQQVDKVDADSIALFLSELRRQNPGKYFIHVILDNAGYHHDAEIQTFAKGLAIKLHYLPPYSPNLNPVERIWKMMHEDVTYNKYYVSFADFTNATVNFFKNIGRRKNILRSRVTDNFQILHSPLCAS
jgi:transposase